MDDTERERWRRRLQTLSAALEQGDDAFIAMLRDEYDNETRSVLLEVGGVAGEMRDELQRFRHTPGLDAAAASELPEARKRIDYLARMTEQAAHETLGLVEAALRDCDSVRAALVVPRQDRHLRHGTEHLLLQMREKLQQMLLAQGYQDLAGQVLKQLDGFLAEMEEGLARIGALTGGVGREKNPEQATGPQVPGVDDGNYVDGQDDVDQLLADLGF